ncbi:MAG: hypothetical protein F7C34_00475 [Desulfurococcales archaeon]|nr:hypothetical protein [Desulfurococcales archaeon]
MRPGTSRLRISELPCEIASREILPSIRAAIVRVLLAKGYSKYTVARMMGLTPASITHYLRGKRGRPDLEEKLLSEPYKSLIEKLAEIVEKAWKTGINGKTYSSYRDLVCTLCSGFNPVAKEAGCPS